MKKRRLGVNIDHVATIRNARGENYPDPLYAALIAQEVMGPPALVQQQLLVRMDLSLFINGHAGLLL